MTAELTPSQANSRFQVTTRPMAAPGHCAVCGGVDKPVVDFNLQLEFFGAVLICVSCMRAAMQIINITLGESELVQPRPPISPQHVKDLFSYVHIASESAARLSKFMYDIGVPDLPPELLEVAGIRQAELPDGASGETSPESKSDNFPTGSDSKDSNRTVSDKGPSGVSASVNDESAPVFDL